MASSAWTWDSSICLRDTREFWRRALLRTRLTVRTIRSRKLSGSGCPSRPTGANMQQRRAKTSNNCSAGLSPLNGHCRWNEMSCGAKEKRILRRASTQFWASVSLGLLATCTVGPPADGGPQARNFPGPSERRHNETILAKILPGRTSMAEAQTFWRNPTKKDPENHLAKWLTCDGDELNVDFDENGIIQSVWTSKTNTRSVRGCVESVTMALQLSTGLGLQLGDTAVRVLQLYGQPDSRRPSTKDGQQLELLYYAFHLPGPDVPPRLDLLCTVEKAGKPGRGVEITLAVSSL